MAKFKKITRFDETLANEGVKFDVYDEHANHYGAFVCLLQDKHSPRYLSALEGVNKRLSVLQRTLSADQKKDRNVINKIAAEFFVDMSLIDWELEGEDGKAIPFTRADAIEYLTLYPFVREKLDEYASDVTHYVGTAEAIAGN
jgi:hypothetical protein